MITIDALLIDVNEPDRTEVENWIKQGLIRPDIIDGTWFFKEIDIARFRLIQELRQDLGLHEDALPVVLRLLDQLYDERRRLRRIRDALESGTSSDLRQEVLDILRTANER